MTTATATKSLAEEFGIKPGTVFSNSWGYDQTNVDFYEVVSVSASGKSVKIRKCGAELVEGKGLVAKPGSNPSWTSCQAGCSNAIKQNEEGTWVHCYSDKPECWDGRKATPYATKILKRGWKGTEVVLSMPHGIGTLWNGQPKFDTIALGYAGH
jgi:hypothetical protein